MSDAGELLAETAWKPPRQKPKRSITLEGMLFWAYREQQVHRYLRRPMDWFLWEIDDTGMSMRAEDRRPVHPDAGLIHAHVMELEDHLAHLMVYFASLGEAPQPFRGSIRLRPVQVSSKMQDYGWYENEYGERISYAIEIVEIIKTNEIRVINKRSRMREERFEVRCCPVESIPTQAFIEHATHMAAEWDRGIGLLANSLQDAEFRAHTLCEV